MIQVAFNSERHEYTLIDDPKVKFISATTLIHSYAQEFNGEFWGLFKALEKVTLEKNGYNGENLLRSIKSKKWYKNRNTEGLKEFVTGHPDELLIYATRESIKTEWKRKNQEACETGTEFHNFKESEAISNGSVFFSVEGDKALSQEHRLEVVPFHMGLDLDNLKEAYYPELRLYMLDYGISGTSDCVYILPNRGVVIEDYKTNKKLDFENKWQKMKFPLNHLDDCNWNHYKLQLSLYMYMLEVRGYRPVDLAILYKDERLPFDYMKKEVEALLEHFASTKQLLLDIAHETIDMPIMQNYTMIDTKTDNERLGF